MRSLKEIDGKNEIIFSQNYEIVVILCGDVGGWLRLVCLSGRWKDGIDLSWHELSVRYFHALKDFRFGPQSMVNQTATS